MSDITPVPTSRVDARRSGPADRRGSDTREGAFLDGFHEESRVYAACGMLASAAIVGAAIVALYTDAAPTGTAFSHDGLARITLFAFFLAVAAWLLAFPRAARVTYVPVIGTAATIAMTGLVTMLVLRRHPVASDAGWVTLAFVFAHFIVYTFSRLPAGASATIGATTSMLVIAVEYPHMAVLDLARMVSYLVAVNVFGIFIARRIECNAREVFSARAVAEEESSRAEALLAKNADLLGRLTHEMRQPLTALGLSIEQMARHARDASDATRTEACERAGRSLQSLTAQIDGVVLAARVDVASDYLERSTVDLRDVLDWVAQDMGQRARLKGLEFETRAPSGAVLATSSPEGLRRILDNVVGNAIQFTEPGASRGRISVVLRSGGGIATIEVTDDGEGIDRPMLESMWRPFVGSRTQAADGRNPGLGLYTVRAIAERLDDVSLEVVSAPGAGTRFLITLPARSAHAAMIESRLIASPDNDAGELCATSGGPSHRAVDSTGAMRDPDLSRLHGAYVAVIEDDAYARAALVDLLQAHGVVVCAGQSASEILAQHEHAERALDAIVSDFRLAGTLTGAQAISTLREGLTYSPDAIIITGEPDLASVRRNAPERCVVLQKPLALDALSHHLSDAVGHAIASQEAD